MADQTSKKLVRDLFRLSELPRLPFIPWVSTFAARLEQISVKEMLSDPTTLSKSLENAQKLFGYDAIISVFDPSLEAEACGCRIAWGAEGELPTVIGHPLMEGATIEDLDFSEIEKRGRLPIILESASWKAPSILKRVGGPPQGHARVGQTSTTAPNPPRPHLGRARGPALQTRCSRRETRPRPTIPDTSGSFSK